MSHFATMPALFKSRELIRRALEFLGISPENIWEVEGRGRLMQSSWSDKGHCCQIGVSLAGVAELKDAGNSNSVGIRSGEARYFSPNGNANAEIGFYWDKDSQGYRVQFDGWEVGQDFGKFFSMAYSVESAADAGLVVTGARFTESGDIQLTAHKAEAQQTKQPVGMAVRL